MAKAITEKWHAMTDGMWDQMRKLHVSHKVEGGSVICTDGTVTGVGATIRLAFEDFKTKRSVRSKKDSDEGKGSQ